MLGMRITKHSPRSSANAIALKVPPARVPVEPRRAGPELTLICTSLGPTTACQPMRRYVYPGEPPVKRRSERPRAQRHRQCLQLVDEVRLRVHRLAEHLDLGIADQRLLEHDAQL